MARQYENQLSGTVNIVTTTETVALVTPPVSTTYSSDAIDIEGKINVTAGTGTTAVVLRIRRGNGITGTVVGVADTDTLAAGSSESFPLQGVDTPGDVAGQVYSLTVQQTGATANGTVNSAASSVSVGQP